MSGGKSYSAHTGMGASPAEVFAALTTVEGIAGWWTSRVSGRGRAGGRLDLGFVGLDEQIVMSVEAAVPNHTVVWRCEKHTGHPEWIGTTIVFILDGGEDATTLSVTHLGLVPDLNCYEQCFAGWEHFLRSIKSYAEVGAGMPFEAR